MPAHNLADLEEPSLRQRRLREMASRSFRVEVYDADGRWLIQYDFPKQPTMEQVEGVPVLKRPGRVEVRVSIVRGDSQQGWYGFQRGEGRGLADLPLEEARALAKIPVP